MQLAELLGAVPDVRVEGAVDVEVTGVEHDTSAVTQGSLFCCIRGRRFDGHDLARDAVAAGANALLVEHRLDADVTQVVVPDVRAAIGPIAASFWGEPSRAMRVVGVTGTNGKTTTTHLVRHVMEHAGRNARAIGTLTGARTTPEAAELQRQLGTMRDEGVDVVAMEVSSHALSQHRVAGTWFEVAAFTNLSPEHLDYHADMDDYFAAKAELFTPQLAASAVICVDDEWGRRLADSIELPCVTVSFSDASDVELHLSGSSFTWRGQRVNLPVGGRFNVSNALIAAEITRSLGLETAEIAGALASAPAVPGRFEVVHSPSPTVVVDYAHTPDGLDEVLRTARELTPARVLVVFGCGGDRDRAKRPLMGQVASARADRVYVTSDNPRHEDLGAIIDEIMQGIPDTTGVVIEPDRRRAIRMALDEAGADDVVVIAGKGHERFQILGDAELPFSDSDVALEELRDRGRDQ